VLYLDSLFDESPLFLFPFKTKQNNNQSNDRNPSPSASSPPAPPQDAWEYNCKVCSFSSALYLAAYSGLGASPPSSSPSPSSLTPLAQVLKSNRKSRRPMVLFLEGVRTNGDAVLEYPEEVRHCSSGRVIGLLILFI